MSDLYLTQRIGRQKHLCVSELSMDTLAEHGLKGPAFRSGLYLYTLDDRPRVGGISVLARVPTPDAAFELLDLFRSTARKKRSTPKKAVPKESKLKSSKRSKSRKAASSGEVRI